MSRELYLWSEIYRPKTIEDCILPDRLKAKFSKMVEGGELSNLLLTGKPGVGKTTVARALCEEIGAEMDFINASKDAGIDVLRNRITSFASSRSLTGSLKVVIMDEADYLSNDKVQPAMRSFIENNSKNCRFILTANYLNRIIEPLRSRLDVIDFSIQKKEKIQLAAGFMKRCIAILQDREVEFDKKALADLIMKHLPDFRKIISELQTHARTMGKIDISVLESISTEDIDELIQILKDPKRFTDMRTWVAGHSDYDFPKLISSIKGPVYAAVADAQSFFHATEAFQDANKWYTHVADMEIHIMYMLMLLMNLDWKK